MNGDLIFKDIYKLILCKLKSNRLGYTNREMSKDKIENATRELFMIFNKIFSLANIKHSKMNGEIEIKIKSLLQVV